MIKRTLYFGNPACLRTSNEQLVVDFPDTTLNKATLDMPNEARNLMKPRQHTAPIEDIGVIVLDHQQITISQALLARLLANNVAVITCDATHHPVGMLLNLDGHTLQSKMFAAQIAATEPLKKQLWQQTIIAKVQNQAAGLGSGHGASKRSPDKYLTNASKDVKSGDSENVEGRAAAYYWKRFFPGYPAFLRDRDGAYPNNLLNYGYAILRAVVARSLTGSGLLPTLGIHHRNQYNAYCLADDIMEPYRPFVDKLVREIVNDVGASAIELNKDTKARLLSIPAMDVRIARSVTAKDTEKSPLMVAVEKTTASLARCFDGSARRLLYPVMD